MKHLVLFISVLFSCQAHTLEQETLVPQQNTQKEIDQTKLSYAWLADFKVENTLVNRVNLPPKYKRVQTSESSFAHWLRHIPLKEGNPKVLLFNGQEKANQSAHAAVIDLDVGTKDLQQCADAVMRLRAEYLLSVKKWYDISFNFTSGDACRYKEWTEGYRPVINGNAVNFVMKASPDNTYAEFKNYMQMVFNYCGTASLSKEMTPVDLENIIAGNVFIQGGFPGHAVIVMDVAKHEETGEKIFLLAQSYMPAQEMHILKNFNDNALSPWFSANFVEHLNTPEWIFKKEDLKQF